MVNIILCDDEVESLQRTQDEIERIKTRLPYPVDVITYTDTDYLMERINNFIIVFNLTYASFCRSNCR